MADSKRHRQQVALWTRVNLLLGGLVTTDNHKWPSEKLFEPRAFNEYLKVFISSAGIGVRSLSILPSPFSSANQVLPLNVHCFPVWWSFTVKWRRNHDGCFPELSCHIWMYWITPREVGIWITNESSFPRAKTVLDLTMLLFSIMGWLCASLP